MKLYYEVLRCNKYYFSRF